LRIIGIDPGYAIIGYGIVDYNASKFSIVNYGAVTTKAKTPFASRLEIIFNDISQLLDTFKPDAVSLEKLYFNTNTTTAIDVAQARGVILLAAQLHGIKVFEYTPLQVKQSVTGYGRAEKFQIMEMTRRLLNLEKIPKPDDTADALALAVCHAYVGGSSLNKLTKECF
jgi:crossover junction endodeoxyribonuclease RuvC